MPFVFHFYSSGITYTHFFLLSLLPSSGIIKLSSALPSKLKNYLLILTHSILLTLVENDVLVSQTFVSHLAKQASCLLSLYSQDHLKYYYVLSILGETLPC